MENKKVYHKGKVMASRSCGDFELVEYLGKYRWLVRFIDTKYETEAYQSNIKQGSVLDKTLKFIFYKYKIGDIVKTYDGSEVIIKNIKKRLVGKDIYPRTYLTVEFIETGFITECTPDNLKRKDKVKDYYKPTVFGVGILGDVKELMSQGRLRNMGEYGVWSCMIQRCYQQNYETENRSYENATVCDRWKRFDYFYEDVQKVEGYEKWKTFKNNNPKIKNEYEFDKDTLKLGNKIYSPETCRFVHKSINAGFTSWALQTTKEKLLHKIDEMNGAEA